MQKKRTWNDNEKASSQTERNWNEIRGESYRFL